MILIEGIAFYHKYRKVIFILDPEVPVRAVIDRKRSARLVNHRTCRFGVEVLVQTLDSGKQVCYTSYYQQLK